jgi:hypothetical protein
VRTLCDLCALCGEKSRYQPLGVYFLVAMVDAVDHRSAIGALEERDDILLGTFDDWLELGLGRFHDVSYAAMLDQSIVAALTA